MTTVDLTTSGDAVVRDLPHAIYLQHSALSASGAKLLVQPGGPARFAHERENPRPPTDAMNLGTAAHNAVLGTGPELVVVDATDWRSNAAKAARREATDEGKVPLLPTDMDTVTGMAAALRAHPIAARLLNPENGEAEVSCFYRDTEHSVDRKCRVDWLRAPDDDGRLIAVDYKSSVSAAPESFARSVVNFGYHIQAAWYRDVLVGLGLARTVPFLFVVQETSAPYLVNVIELDGATMQMGEELCQRALQLYKRCTETGVWSGLNDDGITLVSAPAWAQVQHENERLTW